MSALTLLGADLSGTWKGTVEGRPETVVLELKASGDKLTGSVGYGANDSAPIENAKLDGDKLTFEVSGNTSTYRIRLDVTAESLKGNVVRIADGQEGRPIPMELKRDK